MADLARWEYLRTLQGTDDHVAAVKVYFGELIDDLAVFQNQFPGLPRTPTESPDEDEG